MKKQQIRLPKCPKGLKGEHILRKGIVNEPLRLFGLTFNSIGYKVVMEVMVCQACGLMWRDK